MARPGMSDLIAQVRRIAGVGTAEYTTAGATWWTDDQIQSVLDAHRRDVVREMLHADESYVGGGSIQWLTYRSRHRNYEGGSALLIEDGLGDNRGTATYAFDALRGVATFSADQGGTALYVTGPVYDVHGAAAEVLESWSTALSLDFQFATDGQSFHREQKAAALAQRAAEQRRRAWARGVRFR
ncbi:hypothetical protein [Microcystis phage Mae-JY09]